MPDFNFTAALQSLGPDAAFRLANQARPPADYLFESLLPERNEPSYTIESGTMTVRTTMAGLVAMDSPYPPGGVVEVSKFLEQSAKLANEVMLTEAALRRMQDLIRELAINGQPTTMFLQNEALNFLQKVVIQAHMDAMEWLRGQALVTGAITWAFNKLDLAVDYGVPAANLLSNRTGNDAWDGSTSKFWADIRRLQEQLRYNVRAYIAHPDTINAIVNNDVNKAEILRQEGFTMTIRRLIGDNERPDNDVRATVTLIAYDAEGEIFDTANPGQTTIIPFMPTGKILAVGNNNRSGYRVGEGSTADPVMDMALGYTHIAPTVEGGGRPGRWAQLYTPQERPMHLHGRGVTNGLPVIEAPEKIAVASSDLS